LRRRCAVASCKAILSLAVLLFASAPLALGQGTYTQIDFPGAITTEALGIDTAGDIVGGYVDSSDNSHGFLLSGGVYTTIDDPDVANGFALGINDVGQIVGNNGFLSYLYDLQTQTFTPINFPNAKANTSASAINNAGTIVGSLTINNICCTGFELKSGSYRTVTRQGSSDTQLSGINNLAEAVGADVVDFVSDNFLYFRGGFKSIRVPAAFPTTVGINDSGALVGAYRPSPKSGSLQGFLYQNGTFQEIAFPGSVSGDTLGVNNSGEVVGSFADADQNLHGFTWTPPAPTKKRW
jgi:probable HAF family extracellular repeat protein